MLLGELVLYKERERETAVHAGDLSHTHACMHARTHTHTHTYTHTHTPCYPPSTGRPAYIYKHSWSQVLVPVPPVGGAGGAAAGTQDALVQAIQLLPVLHRLIVGLHVLGCTLVLPLEVRLNGGILLVEVGHFWHKVLDHVHVWERVHLDRLAGGGVNLAAHTKTGGDDEQTQ